MKRRLSEILMAVAVIAPMALLSTNAFAASTCQIGYTGPDSNNMCSLTSTYSCTLQNNNTFTVDNKSTQQAASGSISSSDNTSGANVSSGSATNSNGTTVNVTVTNGTCSVVSSVPATSTPVTPSSPGTTVTPSGSTPGKGATLAPVPAPAAATAVSGGAGSVAVLPDTAGNTLLPRIVSVVAVAGIAAGAARLVILAYTRIRG